MKEELLHQYFYEGLLPIERQMLDASAEGALVDKTPMAAKTFIANRALNAQQYEGVGQRDSPRLDKPSKFQVKGAPNNPTNKEALGSNLRASIPSNTHQHKPHNNLPKTPQGQENQAKAMQNQDKRVDQMEKQIGQIAEFVGQFREQGKLPSSTIVNPNGGFEYAKAMGLRSGKQVGSDPQPSNSGSNEVEELIIEEEEQNTPTARVETRLSQAPKAPKPSNSSNKRKEVPILINSNVVPPNVPFPRRFMQSKKEEAKKDILETLRKVQVNIPLLDAIKQVPRYAKFLKELCTTRKRISSNEVVKLNHLIFPADFYVLEMEESDHSPTLPILLGWPFIKTARTKIDVFDGTWTMEFDGEVINFNLSDSIKTMHPHVMNDFSLAVPPNEDVIEMVAALKSLPLQSSKFLDPISISVLANKLLPSVVQPPTLELKPLPSHLKYVFLGDDETLPVIISSTLTAQEEKKLVCKGVQNSN
ncbi:unnamed protein product [Malus baccata var. baccata]